jgi:hypothetical protein
MTHFRQIWIDGFDKAKEEEGRSSDLECSKSGLPDFSWYNTPKRKNIQNDPKYTLLLLNIPNGRIIYQHLPLHDPPKYNQIGIFGLKIYHLATLANSLDLFCSFFKTTTPSIIKVVEECQF